MRIAKPLLYVNGVALVLNGIMLILMTAKLCPPILGVLLIVAFLLCSVWLSCWAQGRLPRKGRVARFYSAATEHMETL